MDFLVDQQYSGDGDVLLFGHAGREVVLAFISEEALQDNATPPQFNMTHTQRVALAESNIEQLSRVASNKIEAGLAVRPAAGDYPRVRIHGDDLKAAGMVLSTSILSAPGLSWGAAFNFETRR